MRALGNRAYGIFPVKIGYKITARIADDGHIQLFYKLYHVLTEPVFVRRRMSRLINAFVHGTSQMLNEGTINSFVYRCDTKFLIQHHFCASAHNEKPPVFYTLFLLLY